MSVGIKTGSSFKGLNWIHVSWKSELDFLFYSWFNYIIYSVYEKKKSEVKILEGSELLEGRNLICWGLRAGRSQSHLFFFWLNEPSEKQTQAEKNQNINFTSNVNRVKQSWRMRLRPLTQADFFSSLLITWLHCTAWGILVPRQGLNLRPLQWKHES